MPRIGCLIIALAATLAVAGPGAAATISTCEAPPLSCATTMPVGGYCECTARGATQGGTVVARAQRASKPNATAGGCGAHPNAPGCR